MRPLIAFAAAGLVAGCASLGDLACPAGARQTVVAELLFGRNIGERLGVSEGEFRAFVDAELTPRFPDGLSVIDVAGQWGDTQTHRVVREPSKIVVIVLPGNPDDRAKLEAAAEAYKERFRQQSVGIITKRACVSF